MDLMSARFDIRKINENSLLYQEKYQNSIYYGWGRFYRRTGIIKYSVTAYVSTFVVQLL